MARGTRDEVPPRRLPRPTESGALRGHQGVRREFHEVRLTVTVTCIWGVAFCERTNASNACLLMRLLFSIQQ